MLLEYLGKRKLVHIAHRIGNGIDLHICVFQQGSGLFHTKVYKILLRRTAYSLFKTARQVTPVHANVVRQLIDLDLLVIIKRNIT